MDSAKFDTVANVLRAYQLLDQCHDKRLISDDEFIIGRNNLNDKAHASIIDLLDIS